MHDDVKQDKNWDLAALFREVGVHVDFFLRLDTFLDFPPKSSLLKYIMRIVRG